MSTSFDCMLGRTHSCAAHYSHIENIYNKKKDKMPLVKSLIFLVTPVKFFTTLNQCVLLMFSSLLIDRNQACFWFVLFL